MCSIRQWIICCVLHAATMSPAQEIRVISPPSPDPRFKADVLLVVAHPDDETAIGGLLAKLVFDDRRRVAIVYCNRGTGGGNSVGGEQSTSMGLMREIEARQATAAFGIDLVWFLDGKDTPGQDLLQSLQSWGHGRTLESVVRVIRLTRADVVLTWMPQVVAGENHGDHQACGVIATEAFDLAGDPTVFPAQVAAAREPADINQANEGLAAWQPKKLYYVSDASREVPGEGPAFDIAAVSPSKKLPYYEIATALHRPHLTQGDVSQAAREATASGDYAAFREYLGRFRLIYGKAVVACTPRGDLFEGVTDAALAFVRSPGGRPVMPDGVSLSLGGVFSFYRKFWAAHGIEHLAPLVEPALEVAAGTYLHVPLEIHNGTAREVMVTVSPVLPSGWTAAAGEGTYRVPAGATVPVQTFVQCPAQPADRAVQVAWRAAAGSQPVGTAAIDVTLLEWSLPQ